MNNRILYYGKDEPLPEQIPLRAGPLTMVYENGDLRTIRLDKHEVVRRIYAAARDRGWGTAPNVLSEVRMDVREDSFEIVYTCENKLNDLHFVWHGRLAGRADGSLVCEFDGVAQSTFLRNRLGFCVLHPIGMAGKQAHIERVDGTVVDSRFPKRIAPQRIVGGQIKPVPGFDEMRAITCEIETGVRVRIAFEGDIFEMEDQRNWTDGSYKTYCTPLRLPFPVEVKEGERIRQTIALAVEGGGRKASNGKRQTSKQEIEFTLLNSQVAMPLLGMSVSANGKPINKKETARLKALKLAHVRVDVALWEKDWRTHLARAARQATLLGTKLEIALFVSEDAAKELSQFVAATKTTKLSVARYLVHHHKEQATSAKWIALARQHLGKRVVIFSGTNLFFTELNRNRPDAKTLELLNGLCYSFNPQVHAIDNTSLAEAPEAQAETVRTCATFAKGKPLAIGAITLKPRWSLGNPGPEPRPKVSEFDPRQMSLFGAGWTVATLKNVAQTGGAASMTIYETTGRRGVLDGAQVFPMYHVFAGVAEFGGKLIATKSSDTLKVDGLALCKGKRTRVLLANMTGETQAVTLKGLGTRATLKMLDASTAGMALNKPEVWRTRPGEAFTSTKLTLMPYAIAQIDT